VNPPSIARSKTKKAHPSTRAAAGVDDGAHLMRYNLTDALLDLRDEDNDDDDDDDNDDVNYNENYNDNDGDDDDDDYNDKDVTTKKMNGKILGFRLRPPSCPPSLTPPSVPPVFNVNDKDVPTKKKKVTLLGGGKKKKILVVESNKAKNKDRDSSSSSSLTMNISNNCSIDGCKWMS